MEGSRIVFPALEKRSREIWMQSELGCPRIIHGDTPPKAKQREECPHTRPPGEEGAKYRDSFMRSGLNLHVDPRLLLASPTSARYIAIVLGCVLCYTYDLKPPLSGRLMEA